MRLRAKFDFVSWAWLRQFSETANHPKLKKLNFLFNFYNRSQIFFILIKPFVNFKIKLNFFV